MSMRMLIDARHPEETRVAVVKNERIEEFDFESANHKQIKGNIYLAKIVRVEASLQAAFVDYGGERQGFLAFSEIHPDYYQIPKEDRDALLREEQEHQAAISADDETDAGKTAGDEEEKDESAIGDSAQSAQTETVEEVGSAEMAASESLRRNRMRGRRRYKIQDVIRRRQVMLVQIAKEERGNKGAALTTYLSLAGRYSVLMPNTMHHGGVSRKIMDQTARKRLKSVISSLELPDGMGVIVRTAGLSRTKAEIKRDFDYLCRLWDDIRQRTLTSIAPILIHEDGDLVHRAIRDIYSRDIEEIMIEGEDSYKSAKAFAKLLMPSHAKKVQQYSEATPIFQKYGVETQLESMYQPIVQLKSGGYIVINPTEALVSIDINSGRSTREHNIEETATKTNIEAVQEIARQLSLRDMAGLVVIDFIDMDHGSNNRKVEKAMREALKNDRARVQISRISPFGLMEMSRQRLRTGILEASTNVCPMCKGSAVVRSTSSCALAALRQVEDEASRGRHGSVQLRVPSEVAIYILNKKRIELAELEKRCDLVIEIIPDATLLGADCAIEGGTAPTPRARTERKGKPPEHRQSENRQRTASQRTVHQERAQETPEAPEDELQDAEQASPEDTQANATPGEGDERRNTRRRGRRGRRGGSRRRQGETAGAQTQDQEDHRNDVPTDTPVAAGESAAPNDDHGADEATAEAAPKPRGKGAPRRRPRGGARRPRTARNADADAAGGGEDAAENAPDGAAPNMPPPSAPSKKVAKTVRDHAADGAPGQENASAPMARPDAPRAQDGEGQEARGWWQRTFGL